MDFLTLLLLIIEIVAHMNNSIHVKTIVRMIAFMNTNLSMRKSVDTILPMGEIIKNSFRF